MDRICWEALVFGMSHLFRSRASDSAGSFRLRLQPDSMGTGRGRLTPVRTEVRSDGRFGEQETGQVAGARGLGRTFSAW